MRWGVAAFLLVLPSVAAAAACHGPSAEQIAAATAHSDAVVAIVNDAPITGYDWQQAVALRVALDGSDPDAATLKRVAAEELEHLKRNETWIAEARARDVFVAPSEVDAVISGMLATGHMTPATLNARLQQGGVAMATLRGQIAIAIAHAKATGAKASPPFRIAQRHCG
jgi:hypothetical protein